MKPKLISFLDCFINMNNVLAVFTNPLKVTFYYIDGTNSTYTDFDECEYKDLLKNLQLMQ